MATNPRFKTVSVGVIHDAKLGFLLIYNPNWDQYTFLMKKPKPGEDLSQVALVALAEDSPLRFPEAATHRLDQVGTHRKSESVQQDTTYDFHVFELEPGPVREGLVANPNAKFFKYPNLLDDASVSQTTKDVAQAIMERQVAAIAVVSRKKGNTREYLLVDKPRYGYVFPVVRRKQSEAAESLAVRAVHEDTSYDGPLRATWFQEVSDVHDSQRFGGSRRRFTFQVCSVDVTDIDLNVGGNPLEQALEEVQQKKVDAGKPIRARGYWDWFTEDEMRNDPEISPTMETVLTTALESPHDR
jgi:hypothetical protein